MSYYVKVGDETTETPECCDKCYMCQDTYALCNCCTLPDQTTSKPFYGKKYIHKYYCAADCNRVIQDISKKPDWCPIQDVRNNCIYTEFDKELDEKIKRFIPRNEEIE